MVCPYYADYPRIDAARRSARAEVLGKIGVSPGRKVLFSAARLVPVKGLDQLIVQFLENDFAGKGWTYVIAGVGPLEGQLKELAAGKGRGAAGDQGGSVVFVGFQQPAENLALMAHAEMLGLPSRYEPHGIVVAEAMAAGTPVLASDVVGAAKDLVKSGVNGLIFRSGDAGDLRNKLEIMEDAGKMAMMRNEARSAFEAWYLATSPMHVVPAAVRRMLGMAAGKAHTVAAYVAT